MDIQSKINILLGLLEQHYWLGFFINIMLKASIILVVVGLISILLRKYSAAARHLVWMVAVISLLALPLVLTLMPTMNVTLSSSYTAELSEADSEVVLTTVTDISKNISNWSTPVKVIYLSVSLYFILYTLLGIIRIHLLTKAAWPVKKQENIQVLETILQEEGIFAEIEILESNALISPLSWGLFKPVIILPVQARVWSPDRIRNILIHEVCHIQRLDWLSHILSRLALASYWCNPLVWLAVRKLAEEAEQACDDAVVLYGRSQSHYASDLLEIATHVNQKTHKQLLAEAIAKSFLGSRVVAILDSGKARSRTESVWVVRAILTTLTTVAILASLKIVPAVNVDNISEKFQSRFTVNFISSVDDEQEEDKTRLVPELSLAARPVLEQIIFGEEIPPTDLENTTAEIDNEQILTTLITTSSEFVMPQVSLSNISINEVTVLVNPISQELPVYPNRATRQGLEGYSIVEFAISLEGEVMNPVIIESSPGTVFDQTSLDAVQKNIYAPPLLNGEAVGINGVRTRFKYQLNPKPG